MARDGATSAIVDSLLKLAFTGGVLAAGLVAPNALPVLQKILDKQLGHLDKRGRERELRRVVSYMKSQKLVTGSYQHGLQITNQGRQRLKKGQIDDIQIPPTRQWDHIWRIVFYDIPEDKKLARRTLTNKLRELGFYQLQRSVLVHPLPCREAVEKITSFYKVDCYVSYIETPRIDNDKILIAHFHKHLPSANIK